MLFDRHDWCWKLNDGRIWHTKIGAYVSEEEAEAWRIRQDLRFIPPSPAGADGVNDEAALKEALAFYGLFEAPPPPTPEEERAAMQKTFTGAIQARLDDFARTRNYDDALSCASYAASTNAAFAAEGRYMVEARDAAWAAGYRILDDVTGGGRPMPTWEEVLAELPPLEWPEAGSNEHA